MTLYQIIIILTLLVSSNMMSFYFGYSKRKREELAEKKVDSMEEVCVKD